MSISRAAPEHKGWISLKLIFQSHADVVVFGVERREIFRRRRQGGSRCQPFLRPKVELLFYIDIVEDFNINVGKGSPL